MVAEISDVLELFRSLRVAYHFTDSSPHSISFIHSFIHSFQISNSVFLCCIPYQIKFILIFICSTLIVLETHISWVSLRFISFTVVQIQLNHISILLHLFLLHILLLFLQHSTIIASCAAHLIFVVRLCAFLHLILSFYLLI